MATSTLRATWRPLSLPAASAHALQRSSQNVSMISTSTFYVFGGELKPRTPISADVLRVAFDRDLAKPADVLTHAAPSSPGQGDAAQWPVARVGAHLLRHPDLTKTCLLLWGGRGGKEMAPLPYSDYEDVWVFDRDTASWFTLETSGDKPPMRSYGTAVGIHEAKDRDKVYVHAGCPVQGRLASLHVLDVATRKWTKLPDAPGPARGGTAITTIAAPGEPARKLLARWGGFCGHEVGGPLDVFDPKSNAWSSHDAKVEGEGVEPSKRSVHGFVELFGDRKVATGGGEEKQALAVMFMGEGEGAPKELGHDGAGKFLSDAYLLLRSKSGAYSFQRLSVEGKVPEARGWFGYDALPLSAGASGHGQDGTRIVVQGGLNEHNERLGDGWVLDIV
ncbi:uncharacterized protein PFL1_03141 [Pseudozyma flocculosa PF-1]|uniref:Uncharacterized protein n=2 Tax=Pseudozyma flocculosa TaxID=84751 RepID=A0A5C3F2E8_9BASI|nr:uncharacterized protein PFL1_03141 [Pseudozyma flocculosa PF-1]EPQ29386.1 hypothetical protein PFL1_03141 [Pseudozyma flocculosa PF-1]SPO37907.1 uncharacterized protein PSFLO_03384 [Pseudozyma flocculosa]